MNLKVNLGIIMYSMKKLSFAKDYSVIKLLVLKLTLKKHKNKNCKM